MSDECRHGMNPEWCSTCRGVDDSAFNGVRGPSLQGSEAKQDQLDRLCRQLGIPTVAVGLIREPEYAEAILRDGKATLIALGRELLWNPNWPAQTALELGCDPEWSHWPEQYGWWLKRRVAQQGK